MTLRKTLSLLVSFVLWGQLHMNFKTSDYSGQLSIEESLPFLETVSKLYPIITVRARLFGEYDTLPHVCWRMSEATDLSNLRELGHLLGEADGEVEWFLSEHFPCLCLFAQPRTAYSLNYNLPIPRDLTLSLSETEIQEFRRLVVRRIPHLSTFIENRLQLTHKPSLCLDLSQRDLELPGLLDYKGPHSKNFYLVADPQKFSPYTGIITSEFDRMLHYGLTDDELMKLELAAGEDRSWQYKVLPKIFYEPYKDQRVSPTEMELLLAECVRLKQNTSDEATLSALHKLISICDSAKRYKLGLFLDSW